MTKLHDIGYYPDNSNHVQVGYCKICSAEGAKLLTEDCHIPLLFCFEEMTKEEFDIKYGRPLD